MGNINKKKDSGDNKDTKGRNIFYSLFEATVDMTFFYATYSHLSGIWSCLD